MKIRQGFVSNSSSSSFVNGREEALKALDGVDGIKVRENY
jgi:hypothetical protein